jgi:hypothetical protein
MPIAANPRTSGAITEYVIADEVSYVRVNVTRELTYNGNI